MASVAPAADPVVPRPRPRPRPVRRAGRRGVAGGAAWIVVAASLLGGIVALNVAVLRLNMQLDDLARERASLQAQSAALASRLSSAAAAPRIEQLAHARLGYALAPPEDTAYVTLPRR
jgi:cell division protein FtsL